MAKISISNSPISFNTSTAVEQPITSPSAPIKIFNDLSSAETNVTRLTESGRTKNDIETKPGTGTTQLIDTEDIEPDDFFSSVKKLVKTFTETVDKCLDPKPLFESVDDLLTLLTKKLDQDDLQKAAESYELLVESGEHICNPAKQVEFNKQIEAVLNALQEKFASSFQEQYKELFKEKELKEALAELTNERPSDSKESYITEEDIKSFDPNDINNPATKKISGLLLEKLSTQDKFKEVIKLVIAELKKQGIDKPSKAQIFIAMSKSPKTFFDAVGKRNATVFAEIIHSEDGDEQTPQQEIQDFVSKYNALNNREEINQKFASIFTQDYLKPLDATREQLRLDYIQENNLAEDTLPANQAEEKQEVVRAQQNTENVAVEEKKAEARKEEELANILPSGLGGLDASLLKLAAADGHVSLSELLSFGGITILEKLIGLGQRNTNDMDVARAVREHASLDKQQKLLPNSARINLMS